VKLTDGVWFEKLKTALATALWRYPAALAMAFRVVLVLIVIGSEYCVDAVVGVDPSSV
jgi:hypothetical protein